VVLAGSPATLEAHGARADVGNLALSSMRATVERSPPCLACDLVKVQRAMGHHNINSTVAYLSFREEEIADAILAA
jgi:hypothetical protein